MDIGGWIVLSIVFACVGALAVYAIWNSKTGKLDPMRKVPSGKIDDSQVTVYRYTAKTGFKLCPKCDGENSVEAVRCKICGNRID